MIYCMIYYLLLRIPHGECRWRSIVRPRSWIQKFPGIDTRSSGYTGDSWPGIVWIKNWRRRCMNGCLDRRVHGRGLTELVHAAGTDPRTIFCRPRTAAIASDSRFLVRRFWFFGLRALRRWSNFGKRWSGRGVTAPRGSRKGGIPRCTTR